MSAVAATKHIDTLGALSMVPAAVATGKPVVAVSTNRAPADPVGPQAATNLETTNEDRLGARAARRDDFQSNMVVDILWRDSGTGQAPLKPEGGAGLGRASTCVGRDNDIREGEGEGGLRRGPSTKTG